MATETNRTFANRINIPEAVRHKVVELLNARLADAFDLYSQ
jgi:DNA-binding ferritin-like protein